MRGSPLEGLDDAALAQRAGTGGRDAFGALVHRHQALVCAVVYGIVGDRARTEELAQEAFVQAWRHGSRLQDGAKWRAWVCQIARNLALQQRRGAHREALASADGADRMSHVADSDCLPSQHAIQHEEHAMLHHALATLPDEYRLPVILYYWEDMNLERVAKQLDISYEAARQRLVRARAMLRERLVVALERDLRSAKPDAKFTAAVMAALPAFTPTGAHLGLQRPIGVLGHVANPRIWIASGLAAATIAVMATWWPATRELAPAIVPVAAEVRDVAPVLTGAGPENAMPPTTPAEPLASAATAPDVAEPAGPEVSVTERLRGAVVDRPSGVVYGQALYLNNEPVPGALIEAVSHEPLCNPCDTAESDEDGQWDMVLPEGNYYFRAQSPGFAGGGALCESIVVVRCNEAAYEEIRLPPAMEVRGRVVDADTGEALAGVDVVLHYGRRTLTDERGTFAFSNVDSRCDKIHAVKEGWFIPSTSFAVGRSMVADLVLRAEPGGSISGRVVDTAGSPVPDVEVRFSSKRPWLPDYGRARTDADGEYTVTSLPRGAHRLVFVTGRGYRSVYPLYVTCGGAPAMHGVDIAVRMDVTSALAEQWGVDMPQPSRGLFLSAAAEETLDAFYAVDADPGNIPAAAVGGTVVDPEGQPQPDQLVRCDDLRTTTDAWGRFFFPEVPDAVVAARVYGRGMLGPGGVYAELARGKTDHAIVVSTPESHFAGTVLWLEDGSPVTRFTVSLASPEGYDYRKGDFMYSSDMYQVYSDDGTFCLRPLQGFRGDAKLIVEAEGYMEAVRKRVPLSSAPRIDYRDHVIFISQRTPALTVKGTVVDAATGLPIPGVTVIWGDQPVDPKQSYSPWHTCVTERPRLKRAVTDEKGVYRMANVPSHRGELIFEREGYGRRWLRSVNFDLPQRIELEPGARIVGTLPGNKTGVDSSPGANLRYYEGDTFLWHEYVRGNLSGAFVFKNLPPGRYRLSPGGGDDSAKWITLTAGETGRVAWETGPRRISSR